MTYTFGQTFAGLYVGHDVIVCTKAACMTSPMQTNADGFRKLRNADGGTHPSPLSD